MWDHSHINNDTHWLPHIWPYIFTPPASAQNPCFCPKLSPKVTVSHCPSVQNFWKFFTQRPLIGWNLRNRYPNAAYFVMAFVTERPPIFFALHTHVCLRGMLPQTRSEAGKFCFLETESSNLGNTFRCKVMKIKFHFYRLNRSNCALYGWISLEGRDDTGYHPPSQTREGIYPTNTLYKSAPCLSKKMPSVSEDVQAEAF